MQDVVIASAVRTPIGSYGGSLSHLPAAEMGSLVIQEALKRAGILGEQVEEVLLGHVLQGGQGQNTARQAAVKAGIPYGVPAMAINKLCGSGLRAVTLAAQQIRLGDGDILVAGGMESMSRAPHTLDKARWGARMGHVELKDTMLLDGLTCAFNDYHMGITAENIAREYGISREEQDAFAAESQRKAAAAQEAGRFDEEILSLEIPKGKGKTVLFDRDEFIKPDISLEKLASLRPAFQKDGSVTAGNASGINDGAAALVLMSGKKAKELGIKPLAVIRGYGSAGVDPAVMGIGPIPASQKALAKAGISVADLDLIEANEAFASQSLAVAKGLGLDPAKINVNGGAIALGHPIGASGARILVSLLHEMKRRGSRYGLATLCVGGGQGVSAVVEGLFN